MDTHIVERLADYINDGRLKAEMIHVESEHSAIAAAVGSSAAGARTFTATSSQGLALMTEILSIASGMRMPIVMAVANRALSAPINIWGDTSDSIYQRDSGWIQIYVETAQEAFDTTVQAFKIAEDHKVLLPVMVCLDGFTLSHVYEPIDVADDDDVEEYLPAIKPFWKLDVEKPISMGTLAFPNTYMEFKKAQQDAILGSEEIIKNVNEAFSKKFGRRYGDGLVEAYKAEDAETLLVGMGTLCGVSRIIIDELRQKEEKIGLLRIRTFRPFPKQSIKQALSPKLKKIIVFDRDISYGLDGALLTEIQAVLKELNQNQTTAKGYIIGLGGRDITTETIKKAIKNSGKPGTEWLF